MSAVMEDDIEIIWVHWLLREWFLIMIEQCEVFDCEEIYQRIYQLTYSDISQI